MTDSFDLSLYRLAEDVILLLDNINTAEELEERAHRLRPDSVTIWFKDAERQHVICTKIRVRVVDEDAGPVTTIQWKDPFHSRDDWQVVPLEDVQHIEGHWHK